MSICWRTTSYRCTLVRSVYLVPCILLALVSCSSEREGLRELKRLCEKDAGMRIFRTVEAAGYYDAYADSGITGKLVTGKYKFYEFCDDSPSPSKSTAIPEPGCWRVERVERSSGLCYERVDQMLSKVVVDPYPEFLNKYCVAVEKIEKPSSRYVYHSDLNSWEENGFKFSRSNTYIKDNLSGDVLGKYVWYTFSSGAALSLTKDCASISRGYQSYADVNFVESIVMFPKE